MHRDGADEVSEHVRRFIDSHNGMAQGDEGINQPSGSAAEVENP